MLTKFFLYLFIPLWMLSDFPNAYALEEKNTALSRGEVNLLVGEDAAVIFSTQNANFLYPEGSLSSQLTEALNPSGSSDDDVKILKNNIIFFAGCRPQSCDEKAAVIFNGYTKEIIAIALRNFHCHKSLASGSSECDSKPFIDTYYIINRIISQDDYIVKKAMDGWANRVRGDRVVHNCLIKVRVAKCK